MTNPGLRIAFWERKDGAKIVHPSGEVRKSGRDEEDKHGGAGMKTTTSLSSEILTVEEVSEFLRLHPTTIYRMLKRNEIPGFKVGNEWRFLKGKIERWLDKKSRASRVRPTK